MEKNEETKKKACLAVYCNGWQECEDDWCSGEGWCKFHPKYREEADYSLVKITGCKLESLGIKGEVLWSDRLADPFEEMLHKEYKYSGESIFEPIYEYFIFITFMMKCMERAAEKWR